MNDQQQNQQVPEVAHQEPRKEITDLLLTNADTDKYLQAAEKLRTISLRLTKPTDWVQFGESMHLQDLRLGELSTYLQSLYGVNVTILRPQESREEYKKIVKQKFKDKEGKWQEEDAEVDVIEYIYTGGLKVEEVKEIPGRVRRIRTIEPIMGSATTADELYAKRAGAFLDPLHIQPSLIKKKAMANYRGNCLRYLWGLKGITKEDLERAFGAEATKNVKDSTMRSSKQNLDEGEATTLEQLRARILRAHENDPKRSREFLQTVTAFKGKNGGNDFAGYTDIYKVKPESASFRKLVKAVEKIEKEKGLPPIDSPDADKPKDTKETVESYEKEFTDARTADDVIKIENRVAHDKSLTKPQIDHLLGIASVRYDELGGNGQQ